MTSPRSLQCRRALCPTLVPYAALLLALPFSLPIGSCTSDEDPLGRAQNNTTASDRDNNSEATAAEMMPADVGSHPSPASTLDGAPNEVNSRVEGFSPACETATPPGVELRAANGTVELELGVVTDVADGLGQGYAPLGPGCVVPIAGVGQAGLTARFSLRAKAAPALEEGLVLIRLTSLDDAEREPGLNNTPSEPLPFDCQADGWCYLTPLRVEITHMARLPELEGTRVRIELNVEDGQAPERYASLTTWGVFQSLQ